MSGSRQTIYNVESDENSDAVDTPDALDSTPIQHQPQPGPSAFEIMKQNASRTRRRRNKTRAAVPAKKKRTVSHESKVWQFFTKVDDLGHRRKCNTCKQVIKTSGNTTNGRSHLEKHHPHLLKNETLENEVAQENVSKQMRLRPMLKRKADAYPEGSAKKKRCDRKLVEVIVKDFQPFSIVDDSGFQSYSAELDERYVLPSRKHLTEKLLPAYHNELNDKLKEMLSTVDSVAITFDTWTSVAMDSYMAVTAHFLYDSCLREAVLGIFDITGISHTGINLSNEIGELLNAYNLKGKVVQGTTDNAGNMGTTCTQLGIPQLGCFPHTINIVVNSSFNHVLLEHKKKDDGTVEKVVQLINPNVLILLDKCTKITSFFDKSTQSRRMLKKLQVEKGIAQPVVLKQAVITRWNSKLDMLRRIYRVYDHIVVILSRISHKLVLLTPHELQMLPNVIKLLELFEEATIMTSASQYVTISQIIPCVRGIVSSLNSFDDNGDPDIRNFAGSLKKFTKERLQTYEKNMACAISTILDPRFKKAAFLDSKNFDVALKKIEDDITEMDIVAAAAPSTSSSPSTIRFVGILSFLNDEVNENEQPSCSSKSSADILYLTAYLKEKRMEKCDPIAFWSNSSTSLLKKLALKYFIIPGSSVPSERTFSDAGYVVQKRRNRLQPRNVNALVTANKNQ